MQWLPQAQGAGSLGPGRSQQSQPEASEDPAGGQAHPQALGASPEAGVLATGPPSMLLRGGISVSCRQGHWMVGATPMTLTLESKHPREGPPEDQRGGQAAGALRTEP